jgi:peroxiredoxin
MRGLVGSITGMAVAYGLFAAEMARPSPPFEILRLGGPALRVSQYRGKIVALAFIETTCPHCQELTGTLKSIVRDYTVRGVAVLECAFDDGAKEGLPEFQQRFDPPFPVGWNTRAAVMSYLQYNILDPRPLYVPHIVFIDRGGTIRADFPGEDMFFRDPNASIRAELEKLLHSERAVAAPAKGKK